MASEIKVDTVSEKTSANGVAIDSVTLKDGAVYPSSADGGALGAAANEWSDIYIADSGVVYFGNDQEIKITHVADTGLNLKHTATADDKPIVLTLQTGETDLAADDVIGKLAFQAPDEGTGTDAILVSAAIQARAEGNHSSSSNATSIDFMTGASEAATKKLSITSAGHFIPGTDNTYDIGTSSLEFKDGYFDGTLYCDTLNLAGTNHTSIGGAWNLLTTVTASDDATVEFTSSIDSTYGMYAILLHSVAPAVNNGHLRIRLSKDGGSNWEDDANDYQYACEGKTSSTEEIQTVSTGQTYMLVDAHTYADSGDASVSRTGVIYMANPSSASKWTVLTATNGGMNGDDQAIMGHGCGFLQDDGAVNAIQFYMSTGNTASGVFKLYGIS